MQAVRVSKRKYWYELPWWSLVFCVETQGRTLEELDEVFSAPNPVKASKQKRKIAIDESGGVVIIDDSRARPWYRHILPSLSRDCILICNQIIIRTNVLSHAATHAVRVAPGSIRFDFMTIRKYSNYIAEWISPEAKIISTEANLPRISSWEAWRLPPLPIILLSSGAQYATLLDDFCWSRQQGKTPIFLLDWDNRSSREAVLLAHPC